MRSSTTLAILFAGAVSNALPMYGGSFPPAPAIPEGYQPPAGGYSFPGFPGGFPGFPTYELPGIGGYVPGGSVPPPAVYEPYIPEVPYVPEVPYNPEEPYVQVPPVQTEVPPPVQTEVPPPVVTEVPPPVVTEVPPPVQTEVPPPVQTEVPPPVQTEVPPPVQTEVPPPVQTEVPPPVVTEVPPPVQTEVPPPVESEVPPPVESYPPEDPTEESYTPEGSTEKSYAPEVPEESYAPEVPTPEESIPTEVPPTATEVPEVPTSATEVPAVPTIATEVPAVPEVPTTEVPEVPPTATEVPPVVPTTKPEYTSPKGPQRLPNKEQPNTIECQVSSNGFFPKEMTVTKGDRITFRVIGGGKFGLRHGGDASACLPLGNGSPALPAGGESTLEYTVPENASDKIYFYNVEGEKCTAADMSATLNVQSNLVANAPAPLTDDASSRPLVSNAASNLPMLAFVGALSFVASFVQF